MAHRTSDGQLLGYSDLIAAAIGTDDEAVLDIVEHFMRQETGGTLDALSRARFTRLARQSLTDAVSWAADEPAGGMTLAEYCEINGLAYPSALLPPHV